MKSPALPQPPVSLRLLSAIWLGLLIGITACTPGGGNPRVRGNDPWVFRSVMDLKPRMVTLALDSAFWVSYDAGRASLYQVWRDGVNFDGPVYTTAHGPQPVSLGPAWLVSPFEEPWRIIRDGQETAPATVQYRGHTFDKQDQVTLTYELTLARGEKIIVKEKPEYVRGSDGLPGLERIFVLSGVPEGTQVALMTHLNSLKAGDSYQTDGIFRVTRQENGGASLDGMLVLKPNATTTFTAWFQQTPLVHKAAEGEEPTQDPGLALINRSDCQTCHNPEVKAVGPAYVDIAKKYKFTEYNVLQLARKVMNGGAGVWGPVPMTAHPDLTLEDASQMIGYIMTLDGEKPATGSSPWDAPSFPLITQQKPADGHGLVVNLYPIPAGTSQIPVMAPQAVPVYSGILPVIHAIRDEDFPGMKDNFFVQAKGFIEIPQSTNYVFRIVSDDGGRLTIGDQVVVNHDGYHGPTPMDGEVQLAAGRYPVQIDYFQASGGKALSFQWVAHGADDFSVVPASVLTYDTADVRQKTPFIPQELLVRTVPGDSAPLRDVHPAYELATVRPASFEPKVAGMDFLPDGRLVVSTWDPAGSVYVLDNVQGNDPAQVKVQRIAKGLAEPLGLKVVEGEIYVLQKQELTHLIDHDQDGIIDEYRTVCNGWRASANFHEFAFGLVYKDGYFYATLATAINPGGASTQPQIPDRGKVIKISRADGTFSFIASGLRTPNGIGVGVDGELFICDNQGDWLPSSKLVHVREGAFYGSRSVDFEGTANLPVTLPVVWMPQDEVGNSPSQPGLLQEGPYKGQMVYGEVTNGGLKRVFVEKINGQYQGALFHFSQGFEAGINRLVTGPDGALYVGGVGNPGNWSHAGKKWYGLQRIRYTGASVFEPLAVRAMSNGVEIEFTEPLQPQDGFDPAAYQVKQWEYVPTANYGGPKVGETFLNIRSVQVSEDRKRVFLELDGMKAGHVVYVHLKQPFVSALGHELWVTEAWYTLNQIPENKPGFVSTLQPPPVADNQLTPVEQAAGWQLLFNGQNLDGWRTYGKEKPGTSWRVAQGAITLGGPKKDWQFADGGDLMTIGQYEQYELTLDWKIAPGGNSGIIYKIAELPEYPYPWMTGLEMQVLDNLRHPDGRFEKHRAGDLYDLIAARFVAANPAGQWNHVRLVVRQGSVEHWLNGRLIVTFRTDTPEWKELISKSKFAEWAQYGSITRGHIALQDHGDPVWFKNIKIRVLAGV
ncbi:MAG: family 16 glycoside hydrolase [Bacteroidia bacterium]|nr:family 16 glycoside hydrolase [Bacteroidia bacterium]